MASAPPKKTRALSIEHVSPKRLNPAKYNPRKMSDTARARLRRGIEAFGLVDPIIARRKDGLVIGGHQRLTVAKEMGLATVPVVFVDLDDQKAAALNVLLNNPNAQGEWDFGLLSGLLSELDGQGFDATLTGFDDEELERLLAWTPDPERAGEEDESVDLTPPKKPESKLGEIYQLGRHRLMCGDATESTAWDRLMGGAEADMVWTDPPYGVAYQANESKASLKARHRRTDGLTLENDSMDEAGLEELVRSSLTLAWAHCKPGAAWYVAAPAGPLHHVFAGILKDLGVWRHTLQWVKDRFAFGRSDYHYRHEPIFYGWKAGAAHTWNGGRAQDSVLEFPRPSRSESHPTMKPVALVRRAAENSTNPQAKVADPFAGSGTTLIACEQTGRTAYLMEIDPAYCDVIRHRYEALVGQKQVAA